MMRRRWRLALLLATVPPCGLLLYLHATGSISLQREPSSITLLHATPLPLAAPPAPPTCWMDRHAAIRRAMGVPQVDHEPTRPPLNRTLVIAVDSCVHSTCDFLRPGLGVGPSCRHDCRIVGPTGVRGADVVMANAMELPPSSHRPPGQLWIGSYQESPDHYRLLHDSLGEYDYSWGYSPHDDFIVTEHLWDFVWHRDPLAFELPAFEEKRARPWLSVWITNCGQETTGRTRMLQRLRQHGITTASYGKCGRTHSAEEVGASLPAGGNWSVWSGRGRYQHKVSVSSRHLFFYAAENSACSYYHTEKVYHGLLAGSVPVYLGASATLAPLVPPGSVVYADDFDGPAALAAHLRHLASDAAAYARMLEWRTRPLPPAMAQFVELARWEYGEEGEEGGGHADQVRCELCEFLHRAPRRLSPRPPVKCPDRRKRRKKEGKARLRLGLW